MNYKNDERIILPWTEKFRQLQQIYKYKDDCDVTKEELNQSIIDIFNKYCDTQEYLIWKRFGNKK